MLTNQLHQGGTRALLDWDETLFDNFTLPDGIDDEDGTVKALIIDDILFRHGDAPLAFPEPSIMKFYIGRWSFRSGPLWLRYYNAIMAEYNPLENYDRMEERTETRRDTMGNERTLENSTENSGTYTTENTVSAENVVTYSPDNKQVETPATRADENGSIVDDGSYDGNLDIESRIHGNIGVTTSQQMLTAELDLIHRLDLIKYISDAYAAEFCLGVY